MDFAEFWDIQLKLWEVKESLNEVNEEIRNCDKTDKATVVYLFNRKNNYIKLMNLYTKQLWWLDNS